MFLTIGTPLAVFAPFFCIEVMFLTLSFSSLVLLIAFYMGFLANLNLLTSLSYALIYLDISSLSMAWAYYCSNFFVFFIRLSSLLRMLLTLEGMFSKVDLDLGYSWGIGARKRPLLEAILSQLSSRLKAILARFIWTIYQAAMFITYS